MNPNSRNILVRFLSPCEAYYLGFLGNHGAHCGDLRSMSSDSRDRSTNMFLVSRWRHNVQRWSDQPSGAYHCKEQRTRISILRRIKKEFGEEEDRDWKLGEKIVQRQRGNITLSFINPNRITTQLYIYLEYHYYHYAPTNPILTSISLPIRYNHPQRMWTGSYNQKISNPRSKPWQRQGQAG